MSADGSKIVFESLADNLVAGDTNGSRDIWIKDLATGEVIRVSTNSNDVQADTDSFNGSLSLLAVKWCFGVVLVTW